MIHLDPTYPGNCGDTGLTSTNPKHVTCPSCNYEPQLGQDHPLWPVFQRVAAAYWEGKRKHGDWSILPDDIQSSAVRNEFNEWRNAYYGCDIFGPHGEIEELIDLINVAGKRCEQLLNRDATRGDSGQFEVQA